MSDLPHISIVMPNLNGGRFLSEAIESIVNQDGPSRELIVVDGGSTDGSREVLEAHRNNIDRLIVEPDRGQADAIMKGAVIARGEIFNWINSDDVVLPGALSAVVDGIGGADCLAGAVVDMDESGAPRGVVRQRRLTAESILRHPWRGSSYHQPGVWLRRKRFLECGGLDRDLHFAFDREMMIRYLSKGASVHITDETLAGFRLHPKSKTSSQAERFLEEQRAIIERVAVSGPAGLQRLARDHLERLDWWLELENIEASATRGHRITAAWSVVRQVMAKPSVRLGRASARVLSRVLLATPDTRKE